MRRLPIVLVRDHRVAAIVLGTVRIGELLPAVERIAAGPRFRPPPSTPSREP